MGQAGLGPDVNGPWRARPRNTADKWAGLGWDENLMDRAGPGCKIYVRAHL